MVKLSQIVSLLKDTISDSTDTATIVAEVRESKDIGVTVTNVANLISVESFKRLSLIRVLWDLTYTDTGDHDIELMRIILQTGQPQDLSTVARDWYCYCLTKEMLSGKDPKTETASATILPYFNLSDSSSREFRRKIYCLEPTAVIHGLILKDFIKIDTHLKSVVSDWFAEVIKLRWNVNTTPLGVILPKIDPKISNKMMPGALGTIKAIHRLHALVSEPENIGALLGVDCLSAEKIISYEFENFVAVATKAGIQQHAARLIYESAVTVIARNEQAWINLLRSKTESLPPAVRKEGSYASKQTENTGSVSKQTELKDPEAPSQPDQSAQVEEKEIWANYASIFDETEVVECSDCESVLSPAAYFADLLRTLKQTILNDGNSLLDSLMTRRPDLGDLQLTCANTNTPVPYIHIAIEVMESFIAKSLLNNTTGNLTYVGIQTFDTPLDGKEPSKTNINLDVYSSGIQPLVYPLQHFPYNYAVDNIRTCMISAGSSWADLQRQFSSKWVLRSCFPPAAWEAFGSQCDQLVETTLNRAAASENLGLQQEDVACITGESFHPIEFSRFSEQSTAATLSLEEYVLLSRSGRCVGQLWGFPDDAAMLESSNGEGLTFVKDVFLPRSGLNLEELAAFLKTNYMRGRVCITSKDGCRQMSGKLDDMVLRSTALVEDSNSQGLTIEICDDMQAFLRLQKKLGWSIDLLDTALMPWQNNSASPTGVSFNAILQLSAIRELSGLTSRGVADILPLWGPLDSCTFLRIFHGYDDIAVLVNETVKAIHSPAEVPSEIVLAALSSTVQVKPAELSVLLKSTEMVENTSFTLQEVSALYRIVLCCKLLNIEIEEWPAFLSLWGNSFDPFEIATGTLQMIKEWKELQRQNWVFKDLAYVLIGNPSDAPAANDWKKILLKASNAIVAKINSLDDKTASLRSVLSSPTSLDIETWALLLFGEDSSQIIVDLVDGYNFEYIDSVDSRIAQVASPLASKVLIDSRDIKRIGVRLLASLSLEEVESTVTLLSGPEDVVESWRNTIQNSNEALKQAEKLLSSRMNSNGVTSDILGPFGDENALKKRRTDFISLSQAKMNSETLEQSLIDIINSDFPKLETTVLLYLLKNIVQIENNGVGEPALDCLKNCTESAHTPNASDILTEILFWPPKTLPYVFTIKLDENTRPRLLIDGNLLSFVWSEMEKIWVSDEMLLVSGQLYSLEMDGNLETLSIGPVALPALWLASGIFYFSRNVLRIVEDVYTQIKRFSTLNERASLAIEEVRFFSTPRPSFNQSQDSLQERSQKLQIDFKSLTIRDILSIGSYTIIRNQIAIKDQGLLLQFLKWSNSESSPTADALALRLSGILLYPEDLVSRLISARYPGLADEALTELFRNIDEISVLSNTIQYLSKVRLSGATAAEVFELAAPLKLYAGANAYRASIFKLAAHLDSKVTIAAPNADSITESSSNLLETRRTKLIQYLLNHPIIRKMRIFESNQLLEYFLIDVNMGALLRTSRIKQAISTVQLFVQRCFLGLEKDIEMEPEVINGLTAKWKYMEKYVLWEANRKVFLYPENFLDPTLRDNKSEEFKEFEGLILQSNLSEEAINSILKEFLYKIQAVAQLEIQGYLWEKQDGGRGKFHFFARTRSAPYIFYYRKMEIHSYARTNFTYWEPWSKLSLQITPQSVNLNSAGKTDTGSFLIPAVVKGQLYLIIPEITLKTAPKDIESNANESVEDMAKKIVSDKKHADQYWEVKLSWSENRGGKWTPKSTSTDALLIEPFDMAIPGHTQSEPWKMGKALPNISWLRFRVRARTESSDIKSCSATYGMGVQGFLVIDVECCYPFSQTIAEKASKEQFYKPRHLGQFELRDSQFYKSDTLPFAYGLTNLGDDLWTIPTEYSRLKHTISSAGQVRFPDYRPSSLKKLEVSSTILCNEPLLANKTSAEIGELNWTVSFDDTQYARPTGLIVDISTNSAGPQTWFAQPPTKEIDSSLRTAQMTDVLTMIKVTNSLSTKLVELAVRTDDLTSIYESLAVTSGENRDTYGSYLKTFYHEKFAPSSLHNWEFGVHAIMLLMERLLAAHQHELALKVARLVFNPVRNGGSPDSCWLFPPFGDKKGIRAESTQDLLKHLKSNINGQLTVMDMSINEWRLNPFNVHSIARGRPATYMKRIVMKYIEILVAAGDVLFRQGTLETLPLAIQRYIEAAHVLGPEPQKLKPIGKKKSRSFNQIFRDLDSFSNTSVEMELEFPYSCLQRGQGGTLEEMDATKVKHINRGLFGFLTTTYFGVAANPKLAALRGLVEDRLYKIRHCQDIDGNPVSQALFDPPIDPSMLANAAASGLSSPSVLLNDLNSPMPNYRFVYLIQKAFEIIGELKTMGDSFLSAKEKRDSEALSVLKAQQELIIQNLTLESKSLAKEEAVKSIDSLLEQRKAHESRLRYYLALLGEDVKPPGKNDEWVDLKIAIEKPTDTSLRMNRQEQLEADRAQQVSDITLGASITETTAGALMALPHFTTQMQPFGAGVSMKLDTHNIAQVMLVGANVAKIIAGRLGDEGVRAARTASLIRQVQERQLLANQAGRDMKQVDKQIIAQNARVALCEADIKIQKRSITESQATEEWLRNKYSNEKLYAWMESCTRSLHYELYTLAIEMARKAEKAFTFERGRNDAPKFLNSRGYWDSGRDGLFSAQNLYIALKRMEIAYQDSRSYDFEITKNISLRQLNPAALIKLRNDGSCTFKIPEVAFDFDFPGHYFRRIRSVAVSIPCIVGPYTCLSSTLSILEHKYRVDSKVSSDLPYEESLRDERFCTDRIPITSIAISSGQSESGVFELNYSGERYLPFENAGAISSWKLELPHPVRRFDYNTISDVVLHIRYTARNGGGNLKKTAADAVKNYANKAETLSAADGLFSYIDLKNDYSNIWYAGCQGSTQTGKFVLSIENIKTSFPFWCQAGTIAACEVVIWANLETALPSDSKIVLSDLSETTVEIPMKGSTAERKWVVLRKTIGQLAIDSCKIEISSATSKVTVRPKDQILMVIKYVATVESG